MDAALNSLTEVVRHEKIITVSKASKLIITTTLLPLFLVFLCLVCVG